MSEINGQLLSAVEHGKLENVKDLLNQYGLDNSEGYLPLCKSVVLKHTEITKLLLSCGSRVNCSSKITPSNTPLHFAVKNRDVEIIDLLLLYNADMNAENEDGWTPLLCAVSMDSEGIVKLLINKGSSIFIGISPIHVAVEHGLYKMTETLLKLGVYEETTCESRDQFTPLLRATKIGNLSIVELLLKNGAKVNSETTEGLTPMHFASENGNVQIIKLLLNGNADVNAYSKNMFTPLYFAVKNQHREAAKCLVDNGAYINAEFKNGEAVVIENLLSYGFSVKPDDINNTVLLHTAIALGYIRIIEDLIKHGLDCTMKDNFPILHMAAKYNQVKVAKLLLTHGADVNATDEAGKLALYYSTERSDVIMTTLLLSHGANVQKSPELLRVATKNGCKEIVEILLQKKVDIEATDEYGRTALHLTASDTLLKYNKKDKIMGEIAKLLLSFGANVNATTNKEKLTALHIACGNGYTNIVELLSEYKADVNCVVRHKSTPLLYFSEDGDTSLHIAARIDHIDALKIMLKNGADVCSKNTKFETPLFVASKEKFPDSVSILLKHGSTVDSQDIHGQTALFMAFDRRNDEIVELLLSYGSDINILDNHNNSAFDNIYDRSEFGSDEEYLQYIYDDVYGCVYTIIGLHIIMLKTANLYVREEFLIYVNIWDDSTKLHKKKCEDEIQKLKLEKIANTKISFYDILTENIHEATEDIIRVFESDYYKTKFPIYAPIIERNLANITKRRLLLERAHEYLKFYFELPYVCSNQILRYLSDVDLENIINVSKTPLTVKDF